MAILKRYTQLNRSGSNHSILDAESGYITGTFQVGGGTILGDSVADLVQVTGSIETTAATTAKFFGGLSGSLTQLTDGTSYLIAGTGIGITSASNGAVTIASTAAAAPEYWFSTQNQAVYTTGSALFRGPAGTEDSPSDIGTDLFFFVSGTVGSWGTATTGTAGFGGDVVISGSLYVGDPVFGALINDANGFGIISRLGNDVNLGDSATGVGITGNEIKAGLSNLLALSFTGSNTTTHGDLIALSNSFFSGSVFLGDSSSDSIQVTGSLDVANSAIFRSGLSGSLTQLADGTSYIIAGAGITVTSASNGAITINATQFVESQPELYYDATADTAATSGSLAVTGSITLATAGTGYRKLVVGGLDIGPITGAMATVGTGPGIMSGSILSASQGVWDGTNAAMLRHEFHIVGISTDASAYYAGSYLVSTFVSAGGVQSAVGATETSRETAGAASSWDVNINSNVDVTVTGSTGLTVNWYAQRTKEMSISADGSRT